MTRQFVLTPTISGPQASGYLFAPLHISLLEVIIIGIITLLINLRLAG